MKSIAVLTLLFVFGLFISAQAEIKIAYVDLSRVFDEYERTKEYDTVLEKEHGDFEKEINGKVQDVRDMENKLALLKDDEKKKMEEDLEKKKAELLEFNRQKRTDLTKKRDEKIREILLEIEKVAREFAAKEGYSIILNDRVLIYGQESLNITDQVLKTLNEGYSKKEPKEKEKK